MALTEHSSIHSRADFLQLVGRIGAEGVIRRLPPKTAPVVPPRNQRSPKSPVVAMSPAQSSGNIPARTSR
jgi:hypothetical protein